MATIYSTALYDGYIVKTSPVMWSLARDGNGEGTGGTITRTSVAITAAKYNARGGGFSWRVYRTFLWFDTSGISTPPSSATLKIYGYSTDDADFFAVQSEHSDEFVVGDFDAITGWSNSGVDNEGNVTKYSSEYDVSGGWSTGGYNNITLNATALTHMADKDDFKICLIESVHDLRNVEPEDGVAYTTGLYYSDYTGTSRDPYIDYTVATAGDNATFFGCNF